MPAQQPLSKEQAEKAAHIQISCRLGIRQTCHDHRIGCAFPADGLEDHHLCKEMNEGGGKRRQRRPCDHKLTASVNRIWLQGARDQELLVRRALTVDGRHARVLGTDET